MKRNSPIAFGDFNRFLRGLGFQGKPTEKAWVFHHAKEGLLVFRNYGDDEPVDEGDLKSTRKFLDLRGLLEEKDFDAHWQKTTTPA